MNEIEGIKKTVDEHDDSIHKLSEKIAVIEVCYRNLSETLNSMSKEISAIRDKIDLLFNANSKQDARLAEYQALFSGANKSISWIYGIVSSVVTGLTIGLIMKFLG